MKQYSPRRAIEYLLDKSDDNKSISDRKIEARITIPLNIKYCSFLAGTYRQFASNVTIKSLPIYDKNEIVDYNSTEIILTTQISNIASTIEYLAFLPSKNITNSIDNNENAQYCVDFLRRMAYDKHPLSDVIKDTFTNKMMDTYIDSWFTLLFNDNEKQLMKKISNFPNAILSNNFITKDPMKIITEEETDKITMEIIEVASRKKEVPKTSWIIATI